jgi:hypothetical protein
VSNSSVLAANLTGSFELFAGHGHPQGMTHHQSERNDRHRYQASRQFHFDQPFFIFHFKIILPRSPATAMG